MAGGIAAGAAAGTAIMPGIGTAVGAIAGGLLDMAGGGGSAPSPSSVLAETGLNFDFGGWTVASGGSNASGAKENASLNLPPWLMLAGLALVAVVAVKWIAKK